MVRTDVLVPDDLFVDDVESAEFLGSLAFTTACTSLSTVTVYPRANRRPPLSRQLLERFVF